MRRLPAGLHPQIEIDPRYQGYDIGTRTVLRLWRRHRGFGWSTSVH